MIIKRKLYSSALGIKKVVRYIGNAAVDSRDAIIKSVQGALGRRTLQRDAVGRAVREKGRKQVVILSNKVPANKTQLKNFFRRKKNSVLAKAANTQEYLRYRTPGQVVADLGGETIARPVGVGGTAAGYISMAHGIYVPGTTPASIALDSTVRKYVPGYDKGTKSLRRFYDTGGKTKIAPRKVVEAFVDNLPKV